MLGAVVVSGMSKSQDCDRARELGELFVSVTGDDTVTESQEGGGEKQPVTAEEADEEFPGVDDDGLGDAVDADLDA